MAKGQKPPDLPPVPPAPPAKDDPAVQQVAADERARLRARRGRSSTILTRGVLTGAEESGTNSLLGGGA